LLFAPIAVCNARKIRNFRLRGVLRRFTAGKSAPSAEFKPLWPNLPAGLRLRLGANDKFELGTPCRAIKFKSNVSTNFCQAKFERKLPARQI